VSLDLMVDMTGERANRKPGSDPTGLGSALGELRGSGCARRVGFNLNRECYEPRQVAHVP
jgi:hypothetical protein